MDKSRSGFLLWRWSLNNAKCVIIEVTLSDIEFILGGFYLYLIVQSHNHENLKHYHKTYIVIFSIYIIILFDFDFIWLYY